MRFYQLDNNQSLALTTVALMGCLCWLALVGEQISAECPATGMQQHQQQQEQQQNDVELKVGDLANMFSEWTSTRTRQLMQQQQQQELQQSQQQRPEHQTRPQPEQQMVQKASEQQHQQRQESHDCTGTIGDETNSVDKGGIQKRDGQMSDILYEQFDNFTQIVHPSGNKKQRVIVTVAGPPNPDDEHKPLQQLRPGDDIAKHLFNSREPRWMDACNRRPERNETVLSIKMGIVSFHSPEVMAADRLERGNFIKSVLARRNQSLSAIAQRELERIGNSRRKRSIKSSSGVKLYKLNNNDLDKSTMLVKQQPSLGRGKWSTKKTSFSMSRLKFAHNSKAKNRYIISDTLANYQNQPHQQQQLEQYHSIQAPTTTTTTTAVPSTTTTLTSEQSKIYNKIRELVVSMFQLDIRMSWHITGALNTLNHVKDHAGILRQSIRNSSHAAASTVDGRRVSEILTGKRRWLPQFDELVIGGHTSPGDSRSAARAAGLFNITGGLYDPRLKALMVNLTHYIEFFSVALEQMKYDQKYLATERAHDSSVQQQQQHQQNEQGAEVHYNNLDRYILKMLCEAENLFQLESEFQDKKREFYKLYSVYQPETVENLAGFYEQLIGAKLGRDKKYTGGAIDSAIRRAYVGLAPSDKSRVKTTIASYAERARVKEIETARERDQAQLQKQHEQQRQRERQTIMSEDAIPVHIWRDIMPLEQRQLYSVKERAIRDDSILEDLEPLLDCYESLLISNYI